MTTKLKKEVDRLLAKRITKHYKYLFFDLDGTITDPKIGITRSVDYALKSFGIKTDNLDDLCKFIGPPLKESFQEFYGFSSEKTDMAVVKFREYFSVTGIYENKAFDGMETVLKKLNEAGKILIIATSKPTVYAIKILEYFNLLQYFQYVAGSELNDDRSNKAEVIQYALEQNNISNISEVVMIGDRKHDIIGAKENGMDSIGVLFGFGDRDELTKAGADYIIERVEDLKMLGD